jgi:hypothetical protein
MTKLHVSQLLVEIPMVYFELLATIGIRHNNIFQTIIVRDVQKIAIVIHCNNNE